MKEIGSVAAVPHEEKAALVALDSDRSFEYYLSVVGATVGRALRAKCLSHPNVSFIVICFP